MHDALEGFEIDAIRLEAHLVGPPAWDAYSKAKYQWELHYRHMMPLDRLVDLSGGDPRRGETLVGGTCQNRSELDERTAEVGKRPHGCG